MNLAIAYFTGDRDQAIRLLEWIKELGGLGSHKLYLMHAFDCEPIPEILPYIGVLDEEKVVDGDWQAAIPARSAAAPNSMFRQFAWHFHLNKLGPWLFLEPDAIPLKVGWLDQWEAEYRKCGKPFFGGHVDIERVPPHLTGVSTYPENVPQLAPTIIMRTNWIAEGREYELAFDIAGAQETLKQAGFTNLIQHKFRHPGFKTREEYEATIDRNAVVFHSCKDGSIIPFLREDLGDVLNAGNIGHEKAVLASTEQSSPSPSLAQDLSGNGESGEPATGSVPKPHETTAQVLLDKRRAAAAKARAAKAAKRAKHLVPVEFRVPPVSSADNHTETLGFKHKVTVENRTFGTSNELIEHLMNEPVLQPMKPPWKDKEESMKEIRLLSETLKLFCTAPLRTKFVRDTLRDSGVIK